MRTNSLLRVRRSVEPGARTRSRYRGWSVTGVLAAIVIASSAFLALSGGGSTATAKYGRTPGWLPTPSLPVGRVVQASTARPWLAIEGDTVQVHLAAGQVMATVVGPQVPEEGAFSEPATSPCTFTVTFTAASGSVPLNPEAFSLLDEGGHLHRLSVSVQGGGAVPSAVAPGRTVTLLMSAVLPNRVRYVAVDAIRYPADGVLGLRRRNR